MPMHAPLGGFRGVARQNLVAAIFPGTFTLISLYHHQYRLLSPTLLYPRRDLLFVFLMISTLADVRHIVLCLPVEIFLLMHLWVMIHSF